MKTRTTPEYRRDDDAAPAVNAGPEFPTPTETPPPAPMREGRPRDPEDRVVEPSNRAGVREKMFDKTGADSFPASDPPSSIPDPEEDSF